MNKHLAQKIKNQILKTLGFASEQHIIEELFLRAILDSFDRMEIETVLEEAIRDALVRDLEVENAYTKDYLADNFFFLSFEHWENVSETERSRSDMVLFTTGLAFVIECKVLRFADAKYIEEGIKRFVEMKYSKTSNFAGMLGFIVKGKPESIIKNLKKKIKQFHLLPESEHLLEETILDYPLSFQSKHLRENQTPIHIYHLFLDLRENA